MNIQKTIKKTFTKFLLKNIKKEEGRKLFKIYKCWRNYCEVKRDQGSRQIYRIEKNAPFIVMKTFLLTSYKSGIYKKTYK